MADKRLHKAAAENDLPLVKQLLSEGFDVNAKYFVKGTPLHWAVKKNENESHYKVAEVLLKNGADPNAEDNSYRTPFYYLVENANLKFVQLFLSFNANFKIEDEDGQTLLFPAATNSKNVEVVQLLLDLGLDVNHRDCDEKTPLHFACGPRTYENLKIIKCLCKHGADINAADLDDLTPLMQAIKCKVRKDRDTFEKSLSFILEHSDLSITHGKVNILTTTDKVLSEKVRCVIFRHLAKLKALDIPVHPDILDTIWDIREYASYSNRFERELLRVKSTKLYNSWLTFFNLLTDSRKKLKNYAGNSELIEDLQKNDIQDEFPLYGAAINENVKKGIKRRQLYDDSAILLSDCWPVFNPTHLIVRDVIDCIMSKKDLLKFCEDDNN